KQWRARGYGGRGRARRRAVHTARKGLRALPKKEEVKRAFGAWSRSWSAGVLASLFSFCAVRAEGRLRRTRKAPQNASIEFFAFPICVYLRVSRAEVRLGAP